MDFSAAKFRRWLPYLAVLLCSLLSCSKTSRFLESNDPYYTREYRGVYEEWTREARIHRGLEVELIVSATYQSEQFRRAYAEEYGEAHKLSSEAKGLFLSDQLEAAGRSHDFVLTTFVPEQKWDNFDKPGSMWMLYLENDENERVAPLEVIRVKGQEAVTAHFFPHLTPWKSVYAVRFPRNLPAMNEPVIKKNTKAIRLTVAGVLGTAQMAWELD